MSDLVLDNLEKTGAYAARVEPSHQGHKQFLRKTLGAFVERCSRQLSLEQRVLSGEAVATNNNYLPASFNKELIRLTLADLKILELVKGVVDTTAAASIMIPYEVRSTSPADFPNFGIVYEGQGIPFSGVSLEAEPAYVQPAKLALKVTNEIMHFTRAADMNWDAWADNINSNARFIKELLQLRIAAEMQRASDSYQAITVNNEAIVTDANGQIKTAHFPIVRPYQARDLTGNWVGNPKNPISLTLNNKAIPFYDNRFKASSEMYWRFSNLNLGYIQLVDHNGQLAGANLSGSLSYSYATNLIKFDMAVPEGISLAKHLNGLLDVIGNQIAMLTSHRYSRPEFMLMSAMVNNEITKAEHFVASLKRNGSDTNSLGDLTTIKGVPVYDAGLPGDLGDHRIILGTRNLTAYAIAKPYEISDPFQATNGQGRPTGEQLAYAQEFSAVHTPDAVCGRYSSVLLYDSRTR